MALLKYIEKVPATKDGLPNPRGALENMLPPEAIRCASDLDH